MLTHYTGHIQHGPIPWAIALRCAQTHIRLRVLELDLDWLVQASYLDERPPRNFVAVVESNNRRISIQCNRFAGVTLEPRVGDVGSDLVKLGNVVSGGRQGTGKASGEKSHAHGGAANRSSLCRDENGLPLEVGRLGTRL